MSSDQPVDGRHARRERSRAAIIDAVFALVHDGKVPLTAEQVAERAGVSVSSIFRTFDGLSDMQRHAFDQFQDRYAYLIEVEPEAGLSRADRIALFVKSRVAFYVAAGALLQIGRQRALDYEPIAAGVARSRLRQAEHAQRHFDVELRELSPADASNLLSLLDSATSPEAFEVMSAAHGRTQRQISRTWTRAVGGVLDGWFGDTNDASTRTPSTAQESR